MERRTLLAACGTCLAGLAGCSSSTGTTGDTPGDGARGDGASTESPTPPGTPAGTPTETPADTPTETPTETPTGTPQVDASLSVSVVKHQPAIVALATPDSIDVYGDDHQYLFLKVSVTDGEAPAKEDIVFRFDGAAYGPRKTRRSWYGYHNMESEYTAKKGSGWLLYELPPSGDASNTGLTWPGGEWHPAESLRERLAAPAPPMSMTADIPKTVTPGATPTLTLTVTNEGDVDGRFVAAVNRTGGGIAYVPVEGVTPLVPAGETKTIEVEDALEIRALDAENVGDGEPDLEYQVRWTGEDVRQKVRIVETA